MIKLPTNSVPLALFFASLAAYGDAAFVRDGNAGFVVSDIEYALAEDAEITGACPRGMALNLQEIFALSAEGKRRPQESDEDYAERLDRWARAFATGDNGENICLNPEKWGPDPHFRTVEGSDIAVAGIDLDGRADNNDFPGIDGGEPGVDNQFYRVVGCSRSFQSTGQSNEYATSMLTGAWGILISLGDVDDIRNDSEITVRFYANADPIRLSPGREPLAYASYLPITTKHEPAIVRGRIVDGVVISEPVDALFYNDTNSMMLERPLWDARLRATLSEEGVLRGYLSGYTPVAAMYDVQYGYRNGVTQAGELAPRPLRQGSSNGAAYVLGHTCHGAYHALHEHADGHPDASGNYTSISTQYRIEAIPAFVIEKGYPQ